MESFRAWKVGAWYYVPLLAIGIVLVTLTIQSMYWPIGLMLVAAGLFTLNFFRDPRREIPSNPKAIVSPADGKIVAVEEFDETDFYDGKCKRISIFLNVFNVHVNRAPYDGRVVSRTYTSGKFISAMAAESSAVNESSALVVDTPIGRMTVRQIAGLIARRIVCLANEGDTLTKGQRFGMIKFGSRTELYLPQGCTIRISVGDHVKGGETVLAEAGQETCKA